MDPQIIPYGWGLFSEDEEVIVIGRGELGGGELEMPTATTGLMVKPGQLVSMMEGGKVKAEHVSILSEGGTKKTVQPIIP